MKNLIVSEIYSEDRGKKVEIYERPDGSFGFQEFHLVEPEVGASSWTQFGRRSESFVATAEDAEREARERVEWAGAGAPV